MSTVDHLLEGEELELLTKNESQVEENEVEETTEEKPGIEESDCELLIP